jgi:Carboxypeptidase regulatory-like domain
MKTILAAVACLFLAATALATTPTTALTGRVLSGGAPAAGVTVTLTSKALMRERSTVTNADGRYFLTALPPGRYEVTFSRAGLQTLTKRTVLELARVARADATLEPSEDEESITSTALQMTVAETTTLTSRLDDETLDRLPIRRTPYDAANLLDPRPRNTAGIVEGNPSFRTITDAFDAYEEVTVLRGGLTPDYQFASPLTLATTRRGGEDLFLSIRDTLTDDFTDHFAEASVGGRILPERLWYFASIAGGNEDGADDGRSDYLGKLTAQLGAQHNVMALYDRAEFGEVGVSEATARYTGTAGARLTNEVVASVIDFEPFDRIEQYFAKSTYVLGNHVLSAGGQYAESAEYDETSWFVNDRFVVNRLIVNAGVRHDLDSFSPRAAASFDLRGNGRQAIIATFGDFNFGEVDQTRETTLGFATAIGNTGNVRVDAFHKDQRFRESEGLQGHFIYSLFDRFQTGANYNWTRTENRRGSDPPEHLASAWASLIWPFDTNELTVTLLGRYHSETDEDSGLATDIAVRYTLPISRTRLTVAADVIDVFNHDNWPDYRGRAVRGWVRLRL